MARINSVKSFKTLQKNVTTSGVPVKLSGYIKATTISFSDGATIRDSANGFMNSGLRVDDTIEISGTGTNSGTFIIDSVASDSITVATDATTLIYEEEPGATVIIEESVKGYGVANGADVRIKAKGSNAGLITVGPSSTDAICTSTNFYSLASSDVITLAVANLNLIWIDATVSGEGIETLYEN